MCLGAKRGIFGRVIMLYNSFELPNQCYSFQFVLAALSSYIVKNFLLERGIQARINSNKKDSLP